MLYRRLETRFPLTGLQQRRWYFQKETFSEEEEEENVRSGVEWQKVPFE